MKLLKLQFMQTTDKARVTAMIDSSTDEKLRIFCVKHRKNMSEVTEAALLHCLDNKTFINKISPKKEEEIAY